MKKTLLSLFLLTSAFAVNAQISGVQAPDFTATDINGNTHTISEYLAQGKTVIMDISATWCQPCWNLHNTKKLDDLNNAFGSNGSNDIVVLFVEGDPSTTLADLNGTGTRTQGDWVSGVEYAIIDDFDGSIGDAYGITAFPTLFRICPGGIVTNISAGSSLSAIRSGINTNCGQMTGAQDHASVTLNPINTCESSASPVAKLKNYGTNSITNLVLELKENGNVIQTRTYTGSLGQFGSNNITFNPVVLNPASTYTADVSTINTRTPYNNELAENDLDFNLANQAGTDIEIRVYTDNYPTEISWRIKNSAGTIVASAGPYAGNANGGGADANTTKIHTATLPDANDCYSLELSDSFGDGWALGATRHGVEIFSAGNSILNLPVANFGAALTRNGAFKTVQILGVNEEVKSKISLLPNPSNGIFTLTTEVAVGIEVYDITGKIVYTANELNTDSRIDLSPYSKGMYLAKISGEGFTNTVKLIIK